MTTNTILAEYIWIDGVQPTPGIRSKTKVITNAKPDGDLPISLDALPEWGADGSSTKQADGNDSDIVLRPVRIVQDPFRANGVLVLCEVFGGDGSVHSTNHRAKVREVLAQGAEDLQALFGFEQEYTLFKGTRPVGFPLDGFPAPQGPYYCGVGASNIAGRAFYEQSLEMCLAAGLKISGVNWEVMPGQAEIQVGAADALEATDHVWLARWIMARVGELHDLSLSLDPKPALGDWNGAGMHTNFSTRAMREAGGMDVIEKACEAFAEYREEHLTEYGYGYEHRLTGDHETCSHKEFRWGVSDRTASIRIPRHVAQVGQGYMEDRRPNANADPYRIAARMLRTVSAIG